MSDYLSTLNNALQEFQAKNATNLQDYMNKNPIARSEPVKAVNTPVSPLNQLDFERGSDLEERINKHSPDNGFRGPGALINDAANTLGSAYINTSRSFAATGAWAATPLLSAANAIQGKPIQSVAENIESFDKWMGYGDTKEKLRAWESPELQQIRADGAAIDNDPNLSEPERFAAKMQYWGSNPVTALMDGAGEVLKSGAEMALFGGIGKAAGISSTAGKVFAGSSAPGAVNHILGIVDDPNTEVSSKTLPTALAVGSMTGASAGLFAKYNPFDVERWIAGGTVGNSATSRPVAMALGGLGEGAEESIQGPLSEVFANHEKGKPLTSNMGSTFADSAAIGIASGIVGGSVVPVNKATTDSQTLTDALTERADKQERKRNGTLDEQLDMTSDKAAPVRVFKQALYDLNSKEEGVSDFASDLLQRVTTTVETRKVEMEEAIKKETDTEKQKQLTIDYMAFMNGKYNPLKAEVKNYINAGSSPKAIKQFSDSMEASKKNREKLYTQSSGKSVNIDSLLNEIANSSYSTNATTTSANSSNKKSNIASLIQRGESGAKSHTAVNYGEGKKSTNINPTTLTVGDITNGLNKGDFVAVGKYQMHVSSFNEMRQSLDWVNKDTKFTSEVQDRIFAEYYIGKKRKNLAGYITGTNNNLKQANDEFAREWAAAEGSNGKGMYGGNNKATIKASEVQTHLQEAREIYKSLIDKGASPEAALRTAVMFDINEPGESTTTSNTKRDPSTYIKYTNQQAKRNEPLAPKIANALGFLADMGVTFEINSGGQSNTSRGKVGSSAHNHGNAGDGLLKYNGKALDWDNPQDKAMLEKIVEEAAANGINGIGAGYMGKGRVHFGMQDKAATWGNGKDANSSAFGWVAAAHARGLKRKPSTQVSTGVEVDTKDPTYQEDNKLKNLINTLDKSMQDFTSITLEETSLEKEEKKLEKARLARVVAAKGNVDNNTAKVLYSTEQVEALRKVDKLKAELASKNNLSDTQNEIVNGKKSKSNNPSESTLGLKDYDDIFAAALATNDTKTVNLNLAYLERFNENHQSKNALIQKILSQPIPDGGVQIAANASGKWIEVSDKQLKDLEAFKGSKPLTIVGDNRLTQSIAEEAGWISERLSSWSDLTSQLMEGVTPIKLTTPNPLASSYSNTTSTPPVSATPPPTATVSQSFTPVNNISEVKSDGFYLGRGKDSNGETVSISSLDPDLKGGEMNVGKPGWLGDGGTQTKTIDDYIGKFKTYAKEYETFVPQLIEDLSKPLYAYKKPKADSETNFLLSLSSEIKGKSKEEVAGIIGRIESYSYKDGLKLSAPTSEAPTDTQGLPDRKVRSSIDAKGTKLGIAPDVMKPTKAPNELNNKSAVGVDEYTNQYTHTEKRNDGKEELWQVLINRNATTNKIEDISVIQGDRDVEVFEAPNASWSDEATIDWLQKEGYELPGNYKQAAYSNESIELPKMEMDYIDKVSIPKEIKNKAIKVSDMTEKYKGAIDSKNIEEKEEVLYTAIIEPLLNFNPDLKVRISSDLGDNRYDSKTNTIHINPKNKGHILSETARLVIENSINDLAKKLEDNSYDKLDAKNEDLVKLNNELSYIRQIINRNGLLENDSKLSISLRMKLLEALSSNSKLLSMSLTDSEIMKHLQGISYNLDDKKPNNSVFNKIVSAVRTFFNIGNNNEVANLFDKMIELTARTAQIQAMNKDVSFKPSEEGKAHIFQNLIEADSILEMEKSYYSRNNLLAKFKQVTAKSKPLSGIANLASKLKMDLMQGVNAFTSISPNRAQREQLENFLQFRDEFSIHLMDTFAQKKVTYKVDGVKKAMSLEEFTKYEEDNGKVATDKLTVNDFSSQDLKSNLMDADGNIDENTLTAAAIAAYDFFIEYGNRTTNRDKDIRKLLNLDDDSTNYIPSNIQEDYVDGVMLKNVQGHSLGKKVTDLMNIKSNGLGSIEVASELNSSIGEWLVSAMQSADLIHIRSMPTALHLINIAEVGGELDDNQKEYVEEQKEIIEYNKEREEGTQVKYLDKGEITFISVVDKNSKNRNPRLQEIVDASKGTLGYMGNVFGSEVGLIAPTLLSTDEMIDKIRGTTATTSKDQLDMMHTMQQAPMRVNSKAFDAMMTVLDKHRSETLLMMKADVTEEQLAAEHVSDRHSVKSSAEGLLRELSTMTDFVGSLVIDSTGKREAFFDSIYGAKNNRMHYSSNMINFQLSKIHRAMVDYENFETVVDITGLDTQNWYNEDGTTSELGFVMRGIMEQAEGTEKLMEKALEGSAFTQGFTVDKLPSEAVLDHFYKYVTTDEQVTKAVASMDKLLNQSNKFASGDMSNITELVEFWEGDLGSFRVLMELTNLLNAHKNGDKTLTTSIGVGSDGVNNGIAISTIQMGVASDRFLAQVGIIPEGEEYAQVNGYYDTRKIKDLGDYYEGLKDVLLPYLNNTKGKAKALVDLNTSIKKRKFMKSVLIPFGYSAGDKRLQQVAFSQLLEDIKGTMKDIAAMDEDSQEAIDKLKELEDRLSEVVGEEVKLPKGKAILEYWFTPKQLSSLRKEHQDNLATAITDGIKEYAGEFIEERNRNVKIQNGNSEAYLVVRKAIEAKANQAYKESLKNSDTYKGMTDAQLDKLISLEGMPKQFYMENVENILKDVRPSIRTPFNVNSEDKASDFNAMQDTKTLKANEGSVASNKRVSDGNLYSTNTELAVIRMLEESVGITVSSAQVQGVDAFIAAWASAKADAVNRNIHDQGDSGVRNFVSMGKAQNQATFEALKIYHVQLESLASLGRTLDAINSMVSEGVIDTATHEKAVIAAVSNMVSKKELEEATKGINGDLLNKVYVPLLMETVNKVRNAEHAKLEILKRMRVVQQYAGENGEYLPTQADRDSVDLEYAKIEDKLVKVISTINKITDKPITIKNTSEENVLADIYSTVQHLISKANQQGKPVNDFLVKMSNYLLPTMMEVNPNLTLSISDDFNNINNNGSYDPSTNHIKLNSNMFNDGRSEQDIVATILHEVVHAVTTNKMVLSLDPVVTEAFNELEKMYVELYGKASDHMRSEQGSMFNVFEMIAYGLTDGQTMQFIVNNLKGDYKIPKGAGKIRENLSAFMNSITKFFMGSKKNNGDYSKGVKNFEKMQQLIDITIKRLSEEEIKRSDYITKPSAQYSNAQTSPLDTLKSMSNGNVSPEHISHLDSIISSTVSDTLSRDPTTVTDIIDSVSKKALSAGFKLSDKELYTMEIVKATINEYLNTSSGAKSVNELRKVFARVTDKLTYESFLTDPTNATQSQIAIAKRKYQYVKFPRGADKDAHVERVISLLVTSEEFRQVADKVTNKSLSEREGTWFDSLMAYLENIFNAMTGKVIGINNLSNSKQADQLIKRIQIIHNNGLNHQKHKLDIMYEESLKVLTNPLNWTTNKIVDGIFKGIEYSGSKFSQDSTVGSILRATTKVRKTGINEFGETIIRESAVLNDNPSNRLNALGEVVNELVRTKGMKATVEEQLRATNKIGQDRDTIKKSTIKILANAFSRDLTSEESNSITQQLLRPDMSSLLFNGYNVTRVMKLLRNQKERNKEVAKLEAKILNNPNGNDILIQTKSLALYMAKEESVEHVVKNAENIAIGKDSWYEVPMESMNVDLRNDIDVLASLYAFDYTDNSSRKTFLEILASEEEGVKAFLQTHKEMIKLAKEDFKDNPYSYIKGFTPQLTNPLKSLMFAEDIEETATTKGKTMAQVVRELENEGWVKVSDDVLKQDPTDTSRPRTLMYHNDMLYQDYISGALDMKDTHAKGTNVYDLSTLKDLKRVEQAKRNKRRSRDASMSFMNYDPRKVKGNSLIANYDSEGSVINYSYEMSGEVRDSYLERNNNAFEMVGILNSDAHFKPAIAESQRNVANALFTDYEDNYLSDPRQYIVLDPNSPDPDVAMKWKMMPYDFKAEATKLFGKGNPIVVRTNVYNAVFGFRAYSLSEIFDPKHKKESLQGIVATVLTAAMGEKAKMRVIQAERLYQAGIDKMKNFIVIRNHAVLVGNVIANSLLLSLHGVAPVQQAKDMISVWRNGGDYRKAATRIAEIDVELSINQSRPKIVSSLKRERNILNKALEQNPMHMFMKAGLMSTIVEDVGMNTEDTGFKSDLDKKVDEVAEYIPEQIRTAFNWVIMSPGTPLHEFMKHATQFSDLAAKYSLATQKMREGASMKEAITEAQDNFINYDVPTGRGIDYMNRVGFFMFTKFFIRFQQVLLNRLHFKAGSTIGQHILVEQLGFSGVLDPLAVTRLGNVPFQSGILGYDEAFKNISTVSLIPGI